MSNGLNVKIEKTGQSVDVILTDDEWELLSAGVEYDDAKDLIQKAKTAIELLSAKNESLGNTILGQQRAIDQFAIGEIQKHERGLSNSWGTDSSKQIQQAGVEAIIKTLTSRLTPKVADSISMILYPLIEKDLNDQGYEVTL